MFDSLSIVVTLIAFILINILCGLGLSFLLLPQKYRSFSLLISPFLGCGLLSVSAQAANVLGMPQTAPALAGVFVVISYFFSRQSFSSLLVKNFHHFAFVFGLVSGVIFVWPLFNEGYLTWFGAGSDSLGYIRFAYYLSKCSLNSPLAPAHMEFPWYGWVYAMIRHDFLGASFFLSIMSQIFRMDPLYLFNVTMAFYGFLVPLAVYGTLCMCFALSQRLSLVCAFVVSVQPFWIMNGYLTYLNQVGGFAFFILLFGLLFLAVEENEILLYVLTGVIFSILFSHYGVVLPVLAPAALALSAKRLINGEGIPKFLIGCLIFLGMSVLLHHAFFKDYLSRAWSVGTYRPATLESAPFFDCPIKYLAAYFDLVSLKAVWGHLPVIQRVYYWILSVFFVVLSALSIVVLKGRVRQYWGVSFLVFCGFMVVPLREQYWYGLWKLMGYVQFFFVVGGVITLWHCFERFKENQKAFVALFVFCLVAVGVCFARIQTVTGMSFYVCDKRILSLEKIGSSLENGEALGVDNQEKMPSVVEWLSAVYLLKNVPLVFEENDPKLKWFFFSDYIKDVRKPVRNILKLG